jgi:hypothetical protein
MGGAVAVHVAAEGLLPSLVGIVVVDVVEGIQRIFPSCVSKHDVKQDDIERSNPVVINPKTILIWFQ